MGHIINQTIVVSGWDAERVLKAHAAASGIMDSLGVGRLVSGLVQHAINGGAAFFIAPDGSKEGWECSTKAKAARAEFIEWMEKKENQSLYLDWALIELGGDDHEFAVRASPVTSAESNRGTK